MSKEVLINEISSSSLIGEYPNSRTRVMILKPLIIYYSKIGTTARIAEIVLPTIKAVSRRLEPRDWRDRLKIRRYSQKEDDLKKANAIIVEFNPIILLTPVWMGKPISTMTEFLEQIDLHGKRVILGLVGADETNPKAVEKLRRKVEERGSRFVTTIYLRTVTTGPNWIDLGEEDFTREAAKLAELVFTVSEVLK